MKNMLGLLSILKTLLPAALVIVKDYLIELITGKKLQGLKMLLSKISRKSLLLLITGITVGFLTAWIFKPVVEIPVAKDPIVIERPVVSYEVSYVLPPLNCPTPDIKTDVSGYTMPEMVLWGQTAWNWISSCYNSILDAQESLSIRDI